MLWWLKIWMMYLSFVHQLSHPHLGTCALSIFSSKGLYWSTSYINSSWSNTLGKEYDPKITVGRSVSWKVMAMGQRMLDGRVLKIGSKRSKDQQRQGTFFLALSHRRRQQHSLDCSPSAGPATHTLLQNCRGGRLVSTFFCPGCWLPLNHFDKKCIYVMLQNMSK